MYFNGFSYNAWLRDAHEVYNLCGSGKITNSTIILSGSANLTLDVPFDSLTIDAMGGNSITFQTGGKLGYFDLNNAYSGCSMSNALKVYFNTKVTGSGGNGQPFLFGDGFNSIGNGCASIEYVPYDLNETYRQDCRNSPDHLICNF